MINFFFFLNDFYARLLNSSNDMVEGVRAWRAGAELELEGTRAAPKPETSCRMRGAPGEARHAAVTM